MLDLCLFVEGYVVAEKRSCARLVQTSTSPLYQSVRASEDTSTLHEDVRVTQNTVLHVISRKRLKVGLSVGSSVGVNSR